MEGKISNTTLRMKVTNKSEWQSGNYDDISVTLRRARSGDTRVAIDQMRSKLVQSISQTDEMMSQHSMAPLYMRPLVHPEAGSSDSKRL